MIEREDNPHCVGLIVADGSSRVRFSSGIGDEPLTQALATDRDWLADMRHRRLSMINIAGKKYAIAALPAGGMTLLAFSDRVTDTVFSFLAAVDFAYDIVDYNLNNPFDAMTIVDHEGRVAFLAPIHEKFFGLAPGEAIGRPVQEVIENTRLQHVVKSGKAEIGKLQRMNSLERIVSRVPIARDGCIVGAIGRVMFGGPEQVDALSREVRRLEQEVAFYRREADALRQKSYDLVDFIGQSASIRKLKEDIAKIAPLDVPVLIVGESGSGKELVAHALHRMSPRRKSDLVTVNAAALPASLVESELFGYEAGSFTGADRKGRKGKFEQADRSTIFLDEIGDMPLEVQAKLLRVLQDRTVERVGGERARVIDFRLVTATNRDLRILVNEEKFRLDLFYRISSVVIEVPPLRQRMDDIPLLTQHFLREFCERHRRPEPQIDDDVYDHLAGLSWPGNLRQLRHEVERAAIFASDNRLRVSDFARYERVAPSVEPVAPISPQAGETLQAVMERVEAELIQRSMQQYGGNKKRVAEKLGISRSYLYKRLGETEISVD